MQQVADAAKARTSAALAATALSKHYGALTAVDSISFEVRAGETFGLLGPNGAGKTTTLEMIEGLCRPDSGEIALLGLDALKRRREVQERIGVQLQTQSLWPELTVEETLKTFAAMFRRTLPVRELIERLSLTEKRRSLVKGLSGGQKQRLSLATALINDPDIIFLDEPTTGLDPSARQSFWDLIRELRTGGRTLIVTTHYMEEAEALCDRVAIMDRGRIMAMDTPRALIHGLSFDNTVECTFSDGLDASTLRDLPAVHDVTSENESFLLFTDNVPATLGALMDVRDAGGSRLESLHVRTATLEDVFISLTGRRLES